MLIKRQKDLLFFLLKDKKWRTFSQIANEIHCSTKTIQRDIVILKELLPSNWNLQICKGKGVILHKPADSSCSELNSLFIRNEITFKIIDTLFKTNITNISELSEYIYLSTASLYVYLKNTETYLSQFDLYLKRKPLKIYGDSINILFMYQEFYINSYADHEWPFTTQKEKDVCLYVLKIEKKLGIKLYPLYKRKLMYLIAIISDQKTKGVTLTLNQSLINKIIETPFYKDLFHLNQIDFQKNFSIEEIVFILIAVNCSKYVHQNLLAYKENILQHFHNNDVAIYRDIKELIITLEHTFGCELLNNPDFIFAIIQYLKQTLSKYQFFPNFNFPEDVTIPYIMTAHTDTFYKVKKIYTEWVNKYAIKTSISNEEIATLTLQIEGVCMIEQSLNIKILLLIEDGEKWKLYLRGILISQFGSIFHFVHVDIKDINTYDYTLLKIDLIITTFSSVQAKIPIIRISIIPTCRELQDLKNFIYKNSFIEN
ncbi:HTH domain-containing protein [Bacillus thuringiensis]|uniref:helix-turn-helix domain-containing protein n=1 Tax=Bacillus thuringiensis TaxID=1428 RepID=UPI0010AB6D86|nr:helix-turn-helix domain-containing protein [Bacillus thuringiensis]TJZ99913.1 HTH domain-containing protein [Bacillus thuringiensis]